MDKTKLLNQDVQMIVESPIGSFNTEYNFLYPINYGYVINPFDDQEKIETYLLGIYEPVNQYTGRVTAIIHHLDDHHDKLVIMPKLGMYTDYEIKLLTDFQEKNFRIQIIR